MSGPDGSRSSTVAPFRRSFRGDSEPQRCLWSRQDDVTLADPLGPPAKDLTQVFEAMDRAAAMTREGEDLTVDVISSYEGADLAYEVAIQCGRMKLGDSRDMTPMRLRVTPIVRRENDGRKLVHRHDDPITEQRALQSLVQSTGGRPHRRRAVANCRMGQSSVAA